MTNKKKYFLCKVIYIKTDLFTNQFAFLYGVLGQNRTADFLLRRQILYPTELQGHIYIIAYIHLNLTIIIFMILYKSF